MALSPTLIWQASWTCASWARACSRWVSTRPTARPSTPCRHLLWLLACAACASSTYLACYTLPASYCCCVLWLLAMATYLCPLLLQAYDADANGLMELDEFARLVHQLGWGQGGGGHGLGFAAMAGSMADREDAAAKLTGA